MLGGMSDEATTDDRATAGDLADTIRQARHTLQRRANAELIGLSWRIGRAVLDSTPDASEDDGAILRLADDLRAAFPSMTTLTPAGLLVMRRFAAEWPRRNGIVQQPVGQLPWRHILELLNRLDDQDLREWYAGKDVQHTWSRSELIRRIDERFHERHDDPPRDYASALRRFDSDLARELTSDPDVRGFLDTAP
jgi:predicted nuclease of restriction endonuclease-like (RecB) superfamily